MSSFKLKWVGSEAGVSGGRKGMGTHQRQVVWLVVIVLHLTLAQENFWQNVGAPDLSPSRIRCCFPAFLIDVEDK